MSQPTVVDRALPWRASSPQEPLSIETPSLFTVTIDSTSITGQDAQRLTRMLWFAAKAQQHRFLLRVAPSGADFLLNYQANLANTMRAVLGPAGWRSPGNVGVAAVSDGAQAAAAVSFLAMVDAAVRVLWFEQMRYDPGRFDMTGIDWVIVSGQHGSTPTNPHWVSRAGNKARKAGAAFTFTSWGSWEPDTTGTVPDGTDPKMKAVYLDGVSEIVPSRPDGWTVMRRTNDPRSRTLGSHQFDMVPRGWEALKPWRIETHTRDSGSFTEMTGRVSEQDT